MRLFAIHGRLGARADEAPEAAPTGGSLAALILGPLWLLARGLWLALAGYALATVAVVALVGSGALRPGAALLLFALGQIYLAIEGRALASATRVRNGRPLIDVVIAGSALEAEKLHLERAPLVAPSPPPRRPPARGGDEVLGLFPEPGR